MELEVLTEVKIEVPDKVECDVIIKEENEGKFYKPEEKREKCNLCDVTLGTKAALRFHQKIHTGELQFHCDYCGKGFRVQHNLQVHTRTHTGEKPFQCEECDKTFISRVSMVKHKKRTHNGEKLDKPLNKKCDLCDSILGSTKAFTEHRRIHTGEKPFTCEHCGKLFRTLGSLRTHRRLHTGEKPYQCNHCDKAFNNLSSWTKHKQSHSAERIYQCDQCEKAFSDIPSLTKHQKRHTGVADYVCDICSKAFFDRKALYNHRRSHTHRYPCPQCEKQFSTKNILNIHRISKHNEDIPDVKKFNCEHCGKLYFDSKHLNEHLISHTGERPFVCDVCSKSFSKFWNLKVHLTIHTGETPFKCNMCDYGFRELIQLKRHMLKMHQVEYKAPNPPAPVQKPTSLGAISCLNISSDPTTSIPSQPDNQISPISPIVCVLPPSMSSIPCAKEPISCMSQKETEDIPYTPNGDNSCSESSQVSMDKNLPNGLSKVKVEEYLDDCHTGEIKFSEVTGNIHGDNKSNEPKEEFSKYLDYYGNVIKEENMTPKEEHVDYRMDDSNSSSEPYPDTEKEPKKYYTVKLNTNENAL